MTTPDNALVELTNTTALCKKLLELKHYSKMGPEGVFAIVEKARSLGINPMEALNGGFYFVQGKVEMSAQMMNSLVRQARHSITKDRRSDDTVCILHGKRADTGDTWTESFSIEEAKRAGVYKAGGPWQKYPRDMLFARALSRLARQLFPDVVKGCYVEGELSAPLVEMKDLSTSKAASDPEYYAKVLDRLKALGHDDPTKIPGDVYDKIVAFYESKLEATK